MGGGDGISIAGKEVSTGIKVGCEADVFVGFPGGFVTMLVLNLDWVEVNCIEGILRFSSVVMCSSQLDAKIIIRRQERFIRNGLPLSMGLISPDTYLPYIL